MHLSANAGCEVPHNPQYDLLSTFRTLMNVEQLFITIVVKFVFRSC